MSDIVSEFRAAAVFFGSGKKTEIAGQLFAGKHNLTHVIRRNLGKFSNGEVKLEIEDNIRGSNITYFAPDTGNVFDDMMETLITLDCMRRHGAQKIALFLPQTLVELKAKDNPDSPFAPELFGKFIRLFDVDQIRNYDNKPVVFPRVRAVRIIREPGTKTVIARGHSAAKLAKEISSPRELNLPIIDWRKQQNLKGQNVIVLASTAGNPNRAVLETAAMIYNLRRHGDVLYVSFTINCTGERWTPVILQNFCVPFESTRAYACEMAGYPAGTAGVVIMAEKTLCPKGTTTRTLVKDDCEGQKINEPAAEATPDAAAAPSAPSQEAVKSVPNAKPPNVTNPKANTMQ